MCLSGKRKTSDQHRVKANTEGPNVALFVVFTSSEDFWGLVTGCADECVHYVIVIGTGESEIGELDVAF